jgi:hypothetical protein
MYKSNSSNRGFDFLYDSQTGNLTFMYDTQFPASTVTLNILDDNEFISSGYSQTERQQIFICENGSGLTKSQFYAILPDNPSLNFFIQHYN